jgi:hypothetical protein
VKSICNVVKSLKVWNVDFFKNGDENGAAVAEAIKTCSNEQAGIHSQAKKYDILWGCVKSEHFLKFIEFYCGLYEVITKFPHKVYFDIAEKTLKLMKSTNIFFLKRENNNLMRFIFQLPNLLLVSHLLLLKCSFISLNKHIRETMGNTCDHTVYRKTRDMKIIYHWNSIHKFPPASIGR